MATIAEIIKKIKVANMLGIANLAEKGVDLVEDATTAEIMQGIADVSGGGGDILDPKGVGF